MPWPMTCLTDQKEILKVFQTLSSDCSSSNIMKSTKSATLRKSNSISLMPPSPQQT